MKLDFIDELSESRLVRQKKQINRFTAKDAAELSFLYLCTLVILKNEFKYAPVASKYATKTMMYQNFNVFRTNGTDLYIMLTALLGTDDTDKLFADQEASQMFLQNLRVNETQLKAWLRFTAKGKVNKQFDGQMLFKIEQQLMVNNGQYKSVRRLTSDWANLKHGQKTLVITRLIQALKARGRMSELLPVLMKLVKEKKFVSKKSVRDMEVAQPANTKGGMSTRSKIAAGIGLTGAATYGAYKLARHLTLRKAKGHDYGKYKK